MKNRYSLALLAFCFAFASGVAELRAADASKAGASQSQPAATAAKAALATDHPLNAAPSMYKLDFENDQVRVMEVTFKPGEKIAKHTHPVAHYVYVLEAGQLTISKPDGTSSIADLKKGQVMWLPAETHWAQNTGRSEVKLLVSELKQTAGAAGGAGSSGSGTESGSQQQ
jgi:beta-alanine degradation protein BauB